jgi:hypothetical protein
LRVCFFRLSTSYTISVFPLSNTWHFQTMSLPTASSAQPHLVLTRSYQQLSTTTHVISNTKDRSYASTQLAGPGKGTLPRRHAASTKPAHDDTTFYEDVLVPLVVVEPEVTIALNPTPEDDRSVTSSSPRGLGISTDLTATLAVGASSAISPAISDAQSCLSALSNLSAIPTLSVQPPSDDTPFGSVAGTPYSSCSAASLSPTAYWPKRRPTGASSSKRADIFRRCSPSFSTSLGPERSSSAKMAGLPCRRSRARACSPQLEMAISSSSKRPLSSSNAASPVPLPTSTMPVYLPPRTAITRSHHHSTNRGDNNKTNTSNTITSSISFHTLAIIASRLLEDGPSPPPSACRPPPSCIVGSGRKPPLALRISTTVKSDVEILKKRREWKALAGAQTDGLPTRRKNVGVNGHDLTSADYVVL